MTKYAVKTAKRKNCGTMTRSAAIAGEHDNNRNGPCEPYDHTIEC